MHGLVFIVVFDFLLFFWVRVYSLWIVFVFVFPRKNKQTNPQFLVVFPFHSFRRGFQKHPNQQPKTNKPLPKPTTQNQQTPNQQTKLVGWSMTLNFFYLNNETKNGGLSWSGWSPVPWILDRQLLEPGLKWDHWTHHQYGTPLKISLPETNIAHINPPVWWYYLPGKMGIFMGYVSFREGNIFKNLRWSPTMVGLGIYPLWN